MRVLATSLTCAWLVATPALPPALASEPTPPAAAVAKGSAAAQTPTPDTPRPDTSKSPPSTSQPHKAETLEEIVARVQRRLATETARPVRHAAAAPTPQASSGRVTLVWRPAIVWPPELLHAPSDSTASTDRLTPSWDERKTP
jgi:hypothetical protein